MDSPVDDGCMRIHRWRAGMSSAFTRPAPRPAGGVQGPALLRGRDRIGVSFTYRNGGASHCDLNPWRGVASRYIAMPSISFTRRRALREGFGHPCKLYRNPGGFKFRT